MELVGPCRFDHWGADGSPVAKQHPAPYVQVAATGQEHTDTLMGMLPTLMTDHLKARYQIEAGKETIYALGGKAKLKAVTSNPKALEGFRTSFTLLNETHLWYASNQGVGMYRVIRRNAAKVDGRFLALTNAFQPGEESVAEQMREAYDSGVEGRSAKTRTLYDSLEAPAHAPLAVETLPLILSIVRGDATWIKIPNIVDEILDISMPPALSRRFYFNQIVAEDDALYGPEQWHAVLNEGAELRPGDQIVMGFDGGKTDDSTALVAIRLSDRTAFLLELWERPEGPQGEGWEIDRDEVDDAVRDAFAVYSVVGFYADVALWESYISMWEQDFGEQLLVKAEPYRPIWWDMRARRRDSVMANEALIRNVLDAKIMHDGNPQLRTHVLNVRRNDRNPYGVGFQKESRRSPKKIDAYAALVLAFQCLQDYNARGSHRKGRRRTGRVWAFT